MRVRLIKRLYALVFFASLGGCDAPVEHAAAPPAATPAFYQSLASDAAVVDAASARDMISLYRQNNGLGPLALDETLQAAASRQAQDMARRGSVDAAARGTLMTTLAAQGLRKSHAVENVSAGYHTLAEAFSGWRDSAPHNRRMLDPGVTRMGLATAYARGTKYKVFWALILTD